MNRALLKSDAKAAMSMTSPHPVLVTIVYLVVVYIIQFVVSSVSGVSSLLGTAFSDPEAAEAIAMIMMIPTMILSIIASLLTAVLQVGYIGYSLRVINRHPAGIGDLFGYLRFFLKIWGLSIVVNFFTFLWSLLFVIPGIIAAYRYSQAFYILAENPDKGIMECIDESKAMMNGHKMDKFILDLSFFPWYLLIAVTCGIATIYVTPYMQVTSAAFYNTLKYGCSSFQQYSYQNAYQQNGYDQNAYGSNGYNPDGSYQQNYGPNGYDGSAYGSQQNDNPYDSGQNQQ